jgi:hypothetical protein
LLDHSTLTDWVPGRPAWYLKPLHERLLAGLKQSTKLFVNETTASSGMQAQLGMESACFWKQLSIDIRH